MRDRSCTTLAALLCVLAISLPGAALGQQWLNYDSGYSQRSWLFNTKAPTKLIIFAWEPTLRFGDTLYFVTGYCNQLDDFGLPSGKNTVTFKNVQLNGIDSQNTVTASQQKAKIKKGEGNLAVWDLTPAAGNFTTDRSVLVSGDIVVQKKLKSFYTIECELTVIELLDPDSLAASTEAARLSYFRETLDEGRMLPRIGNRSR